MAYYGPNRCGYCNQPGHNRTTCPAKTKRMIDVYEKALKENFSQEQIKIRARDVALRTGIDPLTGKTVKMQRTQRRCTYCKYKYGTDASFVRQMQSSVRSGGSVGVGHTRRTCEHLKKDKHDMEQRNIEFRKQVITGLQKSGIGPGALVNRRVSGYFRNKTTGHESWVARKPTLFMVHKIQFHKINILFPRAHVFALLDVQAHFSRDRMITMGLPKMDDNNGESFSVDVKGFYEPVGTWDPLVDLLSAVPDPHGVKITPPCQAWWSEGRSPLVDDYYRSLK